LDINKIGASTKQWHPIDRFCNEKRLVCNEETSVID